MVIVIGSGAGGSLIAMELAKANIPVTIIERGPYIKSKDSFEYYDMKYYDKRLKNTNSVDLLKTTCIGGSTIVAAGNGVRLLEDEFKELGIDISAEYDKIEDESNGYIIPIGGGKDSNVTLELLKNVSNDNLAFVIGSKAVSMECAKIAGFESDRIIEVKRVIDKNLIDLNQKGFLNGHTPFSSIVAFITYLCASLLGKKYVALSNEDSANESNVEGENINHQYSKTIEFENDFRNYAEKYLMQGPEYFSMLRPITELQIAMLFSKLEQYHKIFKSCNVGYKRDVWHWCENCSKCLYPVAICGCVSDTESCDMTTQPSFIAISAL